MIISLPIRRWNRLTRSRFMTGLMARRIRKPQIGPCCPRTVPRGWEVVCSILGAYLR